jgi:hypothetical protein
MRGRRYRALVSSCRLTDSFCSWASTTKPSPLLRLCRARLLRPKVSITNLASPITRRATIPTPCAACKPRKRKNPTMAKSSNSPGSRSILQANLPTPSPFSKKFRPGIRARISTLPTCKPKNTPREALPSQKCLRAGGFGRRVSVRRSHAASSRFRTDRGGIRTESRVPRSKTSPCSPVTRRALSLPVENPRSCRATRAGSGRQSRQSRRTL